MKHLLRNLLDHKLAVLAIVLLLFAQAFCELSLPNYTADIVDVGIAQYGVDGTYFERMSRETYDNLTLFMTDEEQSVLADSYRQDSEGDYQIRDLDAEEMDALEDALKEPAAMVYFLTGDILPRQRARRLGSGRGSDTGRSCGWFCDEGGIAESEKRDHDQSGGGWQRLP